MVVIAFGALVLAVLVFVPFGGVIIAAWSLPFYLVIFAACVGQMVVAINLILRRPWARVAFLVPAGGMAFSSLFIIVFAWIAALWFVEPTPAIRTDSTALAVQNFPKHYNLDFRGIFQRPAVSFLLFGLNHTIHHRGQLSSYLGCMGAKVPAIYGESYDSAQAKKSRAGVTRAVSRQDRRPCQSGAE